MSKYTPPKEEKCCGECSTLVSGAPDETVKECSNSHCGYCHTSSPTWEIKEREALAEIEHDQWVEWSKTLAEKEMLSPERVERWKKLWVPYSKLTESEKDQDRKYADIVLPRMKAVREETQAEVIEYVAHGARSQALEEVREMLEKLKLHKARHTNDQNIYNSALDNALLHLKAKE